MQKGAATRSHTASCVQQLSQAAEWHAPSLLYGKTPSPPRDAAAPACCAPPCGRARGLRISHPGQQHSVASIPLRTTRFSLKGMCMQVHGVEHRHPSLLSGLPVLAHKTLPNPLHLHADAQQAGPDDNGVGWRHSAARQGQGRRTGLALPQGCTQHCYAAASPGQNGIPPKLACVPKLRRCPSCLETLLRSVPVHLLVSLAPSASVALASSTVAPLLRSASRHPAR